MKARSGVVLLLALLGMVALELTAAALHFAALQQVRAARAGSRALQLRLSAQSAVAAAIGHWPTAALRALPVGGSLPVAGAGAVGDSFLLTSAAVAHRIGPELFLVTGQARSPLGETVRIGLLVVTPDLAARLAPAALRARGGASVASGSVLAAGHAGCALPWLPAAVEVPAGENLTWAPGAELRGSIALAPDLDATSLQQLLPFDLQQLLSGATSIPETAAPPPSVLGSACLTSEPSNRGEPDPYPAASPCATWYPVLSRAGDLVLTEGRGQGILVVAGDLVLSAGVQFSGIVMVAGHMTIQAGATVRGVVLTLGGATLRGGSIEGDRCVIAAALDAVPGLAGPYAPAGRRWIPSF